MWVELIKLTSLLLAFTLLLTFVFQAVGKSSNQSKLLQGTLFGVIASIGMTMPVHFLPGVIFDPRSVLVSIAGLYGGPIMAVPAGLIAGSYRLWLGGAGAIAGILVVLLSALAGVGAYYLRKRYKFSLGCLNLFIFGVVSHFLAIFGLLVLPSEIMWKVILSLAIPFFILYPPLTVFLGFLINCIRKQSDVEKQLVTSNAQLRGLFNNSPDLMSFKDKDGIYRMCNAQFGRLFGVPVADIIGKTDFEYLNERMAGVYREEDQRAMEAGKTLIIEESVVFSDGRAAILETSRTPIHDQKGKVIGVLGVAHDITARVEAQEKLRQSAIVFESTSEGVVITDKESKILDVNQSFSEITGYTREEVIGLDTRILSSGKHDKAFYDEMWKSISSEGKWAGEIWNKRKDGSIFPEWLTISVVKDRKGELTNYIGVFTDISSIKESRDKFNHLAHHDPLTGLPNRLQLNDRLEASISRASRHDSKLAILFIDLDRFKNINDSFGHKAGDELLQHIANGLRAVTRKEDIVSRISGDEFVVLLEDVDDTGAIVGAIQKIMASVSSSFLIQGHTVHSTVSVGISLFPMDGDNAVTLISNADAAMYRAKDEGRNAYQFYTRDLTQKALVRVVMESELRDALTNHEFVLYYQPQIDLLSKKIIGMEALLRWVHPSQGLVSPAQFIPLAEDTGLINPIGKWVIQEAVRQGRKWQDAGIEFGKIAVNVSSVQINKNQLVNIVSEALAQTDLSPSYLELEVTESSIMKKTDSVINQLRELRELGITLSIDDFGTGFSSLSYLKRLPISKLKVDQSFVRGIEEDPENVAIVKAVISLALGLDLTVIAEGVENENQEALLRELKCQEAQGFLYSKPLRVDEIEKILPVSVYSANE